MSTLITVIHVIVCIFLMLTVLLQSGKGGMGAAFGGGGTQTVFGGAGAGGFLRKLTVGAAVTFMLTSMTLAWLASRTGTDALKRYSAQQRRAAQLKKEAREDALRAGVEDGGVAEETTTDGDAGAGAGDDEGAAMSVPGDQGAEGGAEGTTAPEGEASSGTDEPVAPPDEGASDEAPPPIEPSTPAGEAEQPGSRAPPADSPTPG
jgi:preprotein translocase subunit SecG